MPSLWRVAAIAAVLFGLLAGLGLLLPDWLLYLALLAFAKGLVALGLVVLIRGGLVSFGQGLVFCAGAYASALLMRWAGISDAILLVGAGGLLALVLGVIIGPLLAGYRGIFF
ncbi:MAG TPA: branched-chain amino acid ABC transporter permease, partial [Stellaceae bacterium]|nr:branched-chain amino acid ABC transporter permease [Stellaceae bacterium]